MVERGYPEDILGNPNPPVVARVETVRLVQPMPVQAGDSNLNTIAIVGVVAIVAILAILAFNNKSCSHETSLSSST